MDDILKNTFNNESEDYDNNIKYLLLDYDKILDCAVKQIKKREQEHFKILDLGCGTGNLTQKIRNAYPNADIFAIDFSDDMLNIAKSKNIENVKYINADIFSLDTIHIPFFDVIISSYVFHNFHSFEEHINMSKKVYNHLNVNGQFIIADIIDVNDSYKRKYFRESLINLMRTHGLNNEEIIKWLGVLEIEDSPLTIEQNLTLMKSSGFENTNINIISDSAIFSSQKKLDVIQLKLELLLYGLIPNNTVKELYLQQNPQKVWKTGNNGIFLEIDGLNVLVGINHKSNKNSPYELISKNSQYMIYKNGNPLNLNIHPIVFPKWFFKSLSTLNNKKFSDFFVYEGNGYLHLAYKGCSFSTSEKCKFCSTIRNHIKEDNRVEDICKAIEEISPYITPDIHFCLGGGTYLPFEKNVDFFSAIIKTIRKNLPSTPIWVELIPPKIKDIDRLIQDGATAFGFNIEIWDNVKRCEICPGKSQISKEHYIEACKHVIKKMGKDHVGSCLIVGLDDYDNIKEAIDELTFWGIEPCILPYKKYNRTDSSISIKEEYNYDFYLLSKYAADISTRNEIVFNNNYGCLKCSCCTIMHDFQIK